jgi:hypothetical protein
MALTQITIVLFSQQAASSQAFPDVSGGINGADLPDFDPSYPLIAMATTDAVRRNPDGAAIVRVWSVQSVARA